MQLQCRYICVGRRLTQRKQLTNLTKKVVTDPDNRSLP